MNKVQVLLQEDRWIPQFPRVHSSLQTDSEQKITIILNDIKEQLEELKLDEREKKGFPWWLPSLIYEHENPITTDNNLLECIRGLQDIFDFPSHRIPTIRLESSGTLNAIARDSFTLQAYVQKSLNSKSCLYSYNQWICDDKPCLMPIKIALALQKIHQGLPIRGQSLQDITNQRRIWWSKIYQDLKSYPLKVDSYLASNEVEYIEKWTPNLVRESSGEISFQLSTKDLHREEITPILLNNLPQSQYVLRSRTSDGTLQQKRIILSNEAQKGVQKFHLIRKHWKEAEPRIIDAPESILDDVGFDLNDYSDRVVGIEAHVYRVQSIQSEGGERLCLRDMHGASQPLLNLTPEEEIALAEECKKASLSNKNYIQFKGQWIRVPNIFQSQKLEKQGKRNAGVLKIIDNLEEESYQKGGGEAGMADISLIPPGLHKDYTLLPYQKEGFAWLAAHVGIGTPSTDHGLLADDMGLGKTLQTLSVLSLLKENQSYRSALLVAPASLLMNWIAEIKKFFPNRFRSPLVLDSKMVFSRNWIAQTDVVICSYETLRSQQLELGAVEWTVIITDESHRFKNPTSQTTKAILAMQSQYRIALSGTPVQNSLVDIWSQFDWLCPGYLGELRSFKKEYKDASAEKLEQLNHKIKGRFLRRTKEAVLSDVLPPKSIQKYLLDMSPSQEALYNTIIYDFKQRIIKPFAALHQLKRVCTEPTYLSADKELVVHPKVQWLLRILKQIESVQEKVIIFAEWYSLQAELATLISETFQTHIEIINGKVDTRLRLDKIDYFNRSSGFRVMILSPNAAGVGLNITGANHVVHYTRHWNPAMESQATDRAYRIGQTKPVTVYVPILKHSKQKSIEEHIDAVLSRKVHLAEKIIMITDIDAIQKEIEQSLLQEGC